MIKIVRNDIVDKLKNLGYSDKIISSCLTRIYDIEQINEYEIELTFDIEIEAYQRTRKGFYGNMYVPNAKRLKKEYHGMLSQLLDPAFKGIPKNCEITIDECIFYIHPPYKFNMVETALSELGYINPVSRPDLDNYIKSFLDVLTGKLYQDDSNIVKFKNIEKRYSMKPRTYLKLSWKEIPLTTKFV